MATKKKVKVVAKPKPRKKRKVVAQPTTGRRLTDTMGDLFVARQGDNVTVHMSFDSSIRNVVLSVNGRSVWVGQP